MVLLSWITRKIVAHPHLIKLPHKLKVRGSTVLPCRMLILRVVLPTELLHRAFVLSYVVHEPIQKRRLPLLLALLLRESRMLIHVCVLTIDS